MSYLPGIPLASDLPSQSQPQILQNFTQLNTQFGTEHNALDSAAHDGKHKFVTLQQSAGVVPAGTNSILAKALSPAPYNSPYLQYHTSTTLFSVPICITVRGVAVPAVGGSDPIYAFNAFDGSWAGFVIVYDEANYRRTIMSPFVYEAGINIVSVPAYHDPTNTFTYARTNHTSERINYSAGQVISDPQDRDDPAFYGPWHGLTPILNAINLDHSAMVATTVTIKIIGSAL
jgi:hypothetical protein